MFFYQTQVSASLTRLVARGPNADLLRDLEGALVGVDDIVNPNRW